MCSPGEAEHERGYVSGITEGAALPREAHDLGVKLLTPVLLGLVGALGAHPQVALAAQLPLALLGALFEALALPTVLFLVLSGVVAPLPRLADARLELSHLAFQALPLAPRVLLELAPTGAGTPQPAREITPARPSRRSGASSRAFTRLEPVSREKTT